MGIVFVIIAALVIFAYQRKLIIDSQKEINELREECREIKIERDEARIALSEERKKNMAPPPVPEEDDWFDGALSRLLGSTLGIFLPDKVVITSTPTREENKKKWSATGEVDKAARMTNGRDMYGRPYNGF